MAYNDKVVSSDGGIFFRVLSFQDVVSAIVLAVVPMIYI